MTNARRGAMVACMLLIALGSVGQEKIKRAKDKIPDEYIVILADHVPPEEVQVVAEQLTKDHGARLMKVWTYAVKGFFAEMKEAHALAMSKKKDVDFVEENEEWALSASHQTNVDPATCDPTSGTCPTVTDNRLWHLDRADQNSADPTLTYRYCTDGTGVTVYVVDTGVNKFHNEFTPGTRVQTGFNATGDFMAANDPCMGFALPPTIGDYESIEASQYTGEWQGSGHGTAVASALGGKRVGIAKNVTIVPVKVIGCAQRSARARIPSHTYQMYETMFRTTDNATIAAFYQAQNSGVTAATDMLTPPPPNGTIWPTTVGATIVDNTVTWKVIAKTGFGSTQMIIDGLNWILSPANPGPKTHAVVTLSTYRRATEADVAGPGDTVETAIRNLLANDITVVASANNQNGNACDTSPGRMSQNNPDPLVQADVITAGGSMPINRPWAVDISDVPGGIEADGTGKGVEPPFDPTQPVREGRWICGPGDSDNCSNNTPTSTITPGSSAYYGFTGGSNAGPCVTLFVPAKNLFVASIGSANHYRDARLQGGLASGTSWSAPIVAGFAARLLQNNPTYTPQQIRAAMLASTTADMDLDTLNTFNVSGVEITGTPNALLHLSDITITMHPQSTQAALSGPTPLAVGAGGTSTLSYQWYEVSSSFDFATFRQGAHPPDSSTLIVGATAATYHVPAPSVPKAYWVRVTNACGSADSTIAVVVPRPGPPANVVATATGTSVGLTWTAGAGVEQYAVERKVSGQAWTRAGVVSSSVFSFTETPTAPGGMVVYRVRSLAGSTYLPPESLAESIPSINDIANVNTYEVLATPPSYTVIKAQHLIELRQAVNTLCDAVGAAQEYQPADLLLSSLQGSAVEASHFTTLMTKINNVRTNVLLGMAAATFTSTPTVGSLVYRSHVEDLRNALR